MSRVVGGHARHVVVVGAGLAGLSAALHLAGRGREVTVVERAGFPGGRMGRADIAGYRIDTGPTVLTMPDIIDETFAAVGAHTADLLDLMPVDPAYHASFADGSGLEVSSDPQRMAAAIEGFAGPGQAQGYLRLREWLTKLYETEFDGFIGANFDSPLTLLTPQLARLAAMGGFRRWDRVVSRFITDDRLRRWLGRLGFGLSVLALVSPAVLVFLWMLSLSLKTELDNTAWPASSRSSRCTPGCHRSGRWRSTPSSPTWTPSPGCSSRAAACVRCPTRSPRLQRPRASDSTTTTKSSRWTAPPTG